MSLRGASASAAAKQRHQEQLRADTSALVDAARGQRQMPELPPYVPEFDLAFMSQMLGVGAVRSEPVNRDQRRSSSYIRVLICIMSKSPHEIIIIFKKKSCHFTYNSLIRSARVNIDQLEVASRAHGIRLAIEPPSDGALTAACALATAISASSKAPTGATTAALPPSWCCRPTKQNVHGQSLKHGLPCRDQL